MMKNKIICLLIVVVTLFLANQSFAQKITTRKGITYIDEVPYLKITGAAGVENQPVQFVCYKTNKLFLVFTTKTYIVNGKKEWYSEVRFADENLSYNTSDIYIKSLIKNLYDNKILTESGEFEKETLEKYIRLYSLTLPSEK